MAKHPKNSVFPRLQFASDRSLLVTFGGSISRRHHLDVRRLCLLLETDASLAIETVHPAYSSVLVSFDPMKTPPKALEAAIEKMLERIDSVKIPEPRNIEIPVCYDDEFAPDIKDVSIHNKLSVEDVIRIHSSVEYLVYFLGFSPGFPYLGEMPKQIATPRLATPRVSVPAGSVAIGGSQTGVYPIASPGGWRIIGRTPLRLFLPEQNPPVRLSIGDLVTFRAISKNTFYKLAASEQGGNEAWEKKISYEGRVRL
ncbi:MAG: 5-oxoprolinase subunit PxpB [Ignavibacteriales bacterium]|nr:5-oxoprolinase subunit PxpB [Ignavibacteriales bacterium]